MHESYLTEGRHEFQPRSETGSPRGPWGLIVGQCCYWRSLQDQSRSQEWIDDAGNDK